MSDVAVTVQWQAPVVARTEIVSIPQQQALTLLHSIAFAAIKHALEQDYSQVVITVSKNK